MRTLHLVACASALLLTTGVVAAGCVDNTEVVAQGGDAGFFAFDAGGVDAAPGTDATAPADATTDATIDVTAPPSEDAGVDASVTISTATVDFGLVNCGTGTATKTYSFTNTSPLTITYSAVIPSGSVFSITSGASGNVAPGATGSITLGVSAIPTTSTAGTALTSTLTLTTDVPGLTQVVVPLKVTPQGASLAVILPDGGAFGTVSNQTVSMPFSVTNTGNLDAPLNAGITGVGYDAGITSVPATATADGGVAQGSVVFTPTTNAADNGTLTVSTSAPLCSAPLGTFSITATGAIPVASFSATPIAIPVTCAGGAGTVTGSLSIQNTGQAPLSVTGAASTNGNFSIVSSPSSPIAVNATGTITIAATAVGTGTASGTILDDTLTFGTNEPGSPPRSVPVHVTLSGANLAYQALVSNTVQITACGSVSYTVVNTGDVAAQVSGSSPYPIDTPFTYSGTFQGANGATVAANGNLSDSVAFNFCSSSVTPCTASAAPQSFSSFTLTGVGAPTPAGICIPLPPLNVNVSLTGPATCQSACCG